MKLDQVQGGLIKTARINEEWYQDLEDPDELIAGLRRDPARPDIFTFWQRLPETSPRYRYHMEWEDIAVLPISTYDHWWSKQIGSKTRAMVRKAAKKGVVTREAEFDDEFVRGMTNIFNESPLRQGRPFWHFGKDSEAIKREFSTYLFREKLIGAYYEDELIGFIFLADAGRYATTAQIISNIKHRDKAPNNALIAKAVEVCADSQIPYLVYAVWESATGSLTNFKRHNGFERVSLPRYYIPLTAKGAVALKLGLHRGLSRAIPRRVRVQLVKLRNWWYQTTKGRGGR